MAEGAHTSAFLDAVTELYAAAEDMLEHGPCSDPDCCKTAIQEARARARLKTAMMACDEMGQIVQLTERFQHGKVGES